jgi:adenylate cyclase
MIAFKHIGKQFSVISKYRYKLVLLIAFSWTLINLFFWIRYMDLPSESKYDSTFQLLTPSAIWLRTCIVFSMSIVMGYLLVFRLKRMFRNYPLFANLVLKTGILLLASVFMNFCIHYTYSILVLNLTFVQALYNFYADSSHTPWLWENTMSWIAIFIFTQLIIEINEKYSPGVFMDILLGKYIKPQIEKRIIMFLDLQDSTPIAEKLGHTNYFLFIRDFIYHVSTALLEHDGRIYQYVGDEIVVSWMYNEKNTHKCIYALLEARKMLQKNAEKFKRRYGIVPEFKVGIHLGEVTVGEIGTIKRDLAMSGDTMNTTARIRTSCNELNHKYIISKDLKDVIKLRRWQYKSLGSIELKGKSNEMELFALII